MTEKELKVQLNKNYLELEYSRYSQYYITSIIILFTGIGIIIGVISLVGALVILQNILWLKIIIGLSFLLIFIPFILAIKYKERANEKKDEIIKLIKSVDKKFDTY